MYPTRCSQAILDRAINVKGRKAELLWCYIDVEAVPFNRGFYTVDAKFFYKIIADAFCGVGRPQEVTGLATFDKRTVLFGSDGAAKIFSSHYVPNANDIQSLEKTNLPIAVVEVVDPVLLATKLVERHCCSPDSDLTEVPEMVCTCFDDDIVLSNEEKKLYVTLGQFSIIKLERSIQLLMPAYDVCFPEKECAGSSLDPCSLFEKFKFPINEFFPPETFEGTEGERDRPSCTSR
ncbi:MAG: hypothetical protein N2Z65_07545 [Clostridiales bacterium]|nr:hypothetical protein [Clostridiales bacterium]